VQDRLGVDGAQEKKEVKRGIDAIYPDQRRSDRASGRFYS